MMRFMILGLIYWMLISCDESVSAFSDADAQVSSSSTPPSSGSGLSSFQENSSSSFSSSSTIEPTLVKSWQGEALDSMQLAKSGNTDQWIFCTDKKCVAPFSNAFKISAPKNWDPLQPEHLKLLTNIDFRKFSDLEFPNQDTNSRGIRLQIQIQWAKYIHARSVKIPSGIYEVEGLDLDSISIVGESELSTSILTSDNINCHYSSLQNLNLSFSNASLIAQSCSLGNIKVQAQYGSKPVIQVQSANLEIQKTELNLGSSSFGIQLDSATQIKGSELLWKCLESDCKGTQIFTLGKNSSALINNSTLPPSFSAATITLDSLAVLDWTTGEIAAQISSHPQSKIRLRNLNWNGTFASKPNDLLCLVVSNGTQNLGSNCQ